MKTWGGWTLKTVKIRAILLKTLQCLQIEKAPIQPLSTLPVGDLGARMQGLNGRLPPALCRGSLLQILAIANHEMEGAIPSFASTLWLLGLHKNRLKVLP